MIVEGLQTPRLKRLAEIVSAQASAQQDKPEFDHLDEVSEQEPHGLAITDAEQPEGYFDQDG